MLVKTILCVLALAVASLAAPLEEAPQVPEKSTLTSSKEESQPAQVTIQNKQSDGIHPLPGVASGKNPISVAPLDGPQVGGGVSGLDLANNPDANPEEGDQSDLDTANTWGFGYGGWGGWGRGWGGGWGGYHRPYWGHRRWGGWGPGYGWGGYWG